jgi:copper(I)-binding protein
MPPCPPSQGRRLCLRAALAGTATAGLALLGAAPRPVQACEVQARWLRITHPWTRATAADGQTAVLCMKFDEVTADERLIGVATPVSTGSKLAGSLAPPDFDFAIPAGRETYLDDSGIHVLLTGLLHPLEIGRSYPLRLHFAGSGWVDHTLSVDYGRFR